MFAKSHRPIDFPTVGRDVPQTRHVANAKHPKGNPTESAILFRFTNDTRRSTGPSESRDFEKAGAHDHTTVMHGWRVCEGAGLGGRGGEAPAEPHARKQGFLRVAA
jgi:hypothetical protein